MLPASRNRTYAEGVPIHPGDLNDIMDCIIQRAHGDRVRNIPGTAAIYIEENNPVPGTGAVSVDVVYPTNGYKGAITTGAAVDLHWALEYDVGDRPKSITWRISGDGAVDISAADVGYVDNTGTEHALGGVVAVNNVAAGAHDLTIDLTDHILAAGERLFCQLIVAGASLTVYGVDITYDHPLA